MGLLVVIHPIHRVFRYYVFIRNLPFSHQIIWFFVTLCPIFDVYESVTQNIKP